LIESRTKSVESFAEKISRPGKSYKNPLKELSDLSGIRIIVYYNDEVEKVAKIIEEEFKIIELENSHQAENYSADKFGYLSLHNIIKLKDERLSLPEWKSYKEFISEIQIRTVLQHSWAAVSHALQYKNESDIPKHLRRKLFRLAGLFELADEEFMSVRNKTEMAHINAAKALAHGDDTLPIDKITLSEFLLKWEKLDNIVKLMKKIGYSVEPIEDNIDYFAYDYLGSIVYHCERIGIKNFGELKKSLDFNPESYLKAIKQENMEWQVSEGFALLLLLIGSNIDKFSVEDLVAKGWSETTANRVIKRAQSNAKKS